MSADAINNIRALVSKHEKELRGVDWIYLPLADVRLLLEPVRDSGIDVGAQYIGPQGRLATVLRVSVDAAGKRVHYRRSDNNRLATASLAAFQQRFRRAGE